LIEVDSMSFEFAVKKHSVEDVPSYSNNGRVKNPKTGNNFFEAADLDPDTYFAIDELEVGGITPPLEMPVSSSEKYFRIVKLQALTKPHKANLEQDYDKITMAAKEDKKAEYFSNWIQGKMKDTFVEIDPIIGECENLMIYQK
jgi:peptidyl-prolyl cis-trans isomerase SurA